MVFIFSISKCYYSVAQRNLFSAIILGQGSNPTLVDFLYIIKIKNNSMGI
jgi:hypothetical protein